VFIVTDSDYHMKFSIPLISQLVVLALSQTSLAFQIPSRDNVHSAIPSERRGTFSNAELETAFFSIDVESKGNVPRLSFGEAISDLGLDLSEVQLDILFQKYDADKGGSIDLDEFKELMSDPVLAGLTPSRDVKFAMDLFKTYDADKSGSIDKGEFRVIAREIQADARRRSIFSIAAAAIGATIVADYSQEYQFAQKKFRSFYIEPLAEVAQKKAFPTALLSSDADEAIAKTLYRRGFTPKNTILAHSICSDEVNNAPEQLVPLMMKRWEEGFSLGGLAGVPFAGKSGFAACLHHVPDNGKLLIMFAPHVGIDATGKLGALQRDGQVKVSSACGAAVGAYKALQTKAAASVPDNEADPESFDPQLQSIVTMLKPRLEGIEMAIDPITYVTYQLYAIIRDKVCDCVSQTPELWEFTNEVALVGGIMINRRVGGDFFQPLSFESRSKEGDNVERTDLYEDAFGKRADLSSVLGSEKAVACFYNKK